MLLDQNTIVLNPANGFYDEYTLSPTSGNILPGAVVGQTSIAETWSKAKYPFIDEDDFDADDYPKKHVITAGYIGSTAITSDDLDEFEVLILVENALQGKGIHHLYFPGECTPVYSPVPGDRFLVRCVPGLNYTEGEALYLTSYNNTTTGVKGYYFTNVPNPDGTKTHTSNNTTVNYPVTSSTIKAFAAEDFNVPETTELTRKPYPIMIDAIDTSTSERPSDTAFANTLVNLLRVRMA